MLYSCRKSGGVEGEKKGNLVDLRVLPWKGNRTIVRKPTSCTNEHSAGVVSMSLSNGIGS